MGRRHGKHDHKARALFVSNDVENSPSSEMGGMTFVEKSFFDRLTTKVIVHQESLKSLDPDLVSAFTKLWESVIGQKDDSDEVISNDFIGTFGPDGSVVTKEAAVLFTQIGAERRATNYVRINPLAVNKSNNTSIIVYEYTWDFFGSDNNRVVECGQISETWSKTKDGWKLISDSGGPTL
ncbi:nuclear transport factor 2 family protein [Pseudoalteromonas maricaloris]|uniref:nuclear transport factor 2 family protein n=1 Tax=Pseudoalteromonas maricaloris TaxID=184924 RepID=UPI00057E0A2C|nr:nuclear transport factor 2 family protein [Pseudoalteromonas flavipulchra]KID37617.1 hypothetical protein QT15_06135 [Pseudoalteromonas flavipulchra NCIMB 2033 = ATCC BAA-314]MBD0783643.1 nuclear transport factor 2 family protein [Pseudoalteromonas flavipulchra]MBE0374383.1 hypothetical protein [Pseudoalteromonas flavipulchra NCIMB 2033 = ATCC BAA-314]